MATMNPADRSVINMDDALVRRLRQIEVPRSTDALRTILSAAGMEDKLREQVSDWFDGLPSDAPFGHGLFVDVATEQDLNSLWNEQLAFFLRRGGISVYNDPRRIEDGFLWRMPQYAKGARPDTAEGVLIEDAEIPHENAEQDNVQTDNT
jgi:5-methylcytosine-specific restriction protein B